MNCHENEKNINENKKQNSKNIIKEALMKKIIILTLSLMVTLSLLVGCSTKSKSAVVYKNGTYEVSFNKQDKNGWIGKVKINIVNTKIANVDFNYISAVTKELITDDDTHAKLMYAVTKTTPAKTSKQLTDNLIKTQDITKVDTVTGATTTTLDFKTLSEAALENAKKGSPVVEVIPYSK
ncbi:MAG TPA: hypothetical protein VIM70_09000 [Clostridium sp.]|uniref:hypothetical protein n=1 Tax=Clostridium sp. TaxID=1506 RepID=UPI002F92BBCC